MLKRLPNFVRDELPWDWEWPFDSVYLDAVVDAFVEHKVPIRVRYALLKELLSPKLLTLICNDIKVGPIYVLRGLRQGSHEAGFLFAISIGDALAKLDKKIEKNWSWDQLSQLRWQ